MTANPTMTALVESKHITQRQRVRVLLNVPYRRAVREDGKSEISPNVCMRTSDGKAPASCFWRERKRPMLPGGQYPKVVYNK